MNKVILRVCDLNANLKGAGELFHVSFELFEGEVSSVLGLDLSGKSLLLKLFRDTELLRVSKYRIYFEEELIKRNIDIYTQAYFLTPKNYEIRKWTVLEYICLERMCWVLSKREEHLLACGLKRLFKDLDIPLDPKSKICDLTATEQRIMDVCRAIVNKKKILIIEDDFEGMNQAAIRHFSQVLRRMIKGRMTAIVFSHSDVASEALADKYLIFRKGQLVKKYIADQVDNKEVLENYFLGRTLRIEKRKLEINRQKNNYENNHEIVFEVRNFLVKSGVRLNLQFKSGEITTFLSLNKDTEERIFCSLSGRKIDDHASYLILRRTNNMLKYNDFIYNRIISIDHLGEANRDGTMPTMTAAANVLLPSMGKLNSFEYILNEKGLNSVADSMLASSGWDYSAEKVSDMTTNERIRIIMERWKLFKPRVLIFHNPFGNCDSYGVALVKSYMRYFAKEGTAVIIIKNRHEYISEFSDRIIKVDDM